MIAVIERKRCVPAHLLAGIDDPWIAKPIRIGARTGLLVELPDIYENTCELAEHWLAEGVRRLTHRPTAKPETGPPEWLLAELAQALPRQALRVRSDNASITVDGIRWTLSCREGALEVRSPRVAPIEPRTLPQVAAWAAAVNAGVRLVRLHVAVDGARALARLPLGPTRDDARHVLADRTVTAARALACLERALPDPAAIASRDFARVLQLYFPKGQVVRRAHKNRAHKNSTHKNK